MDNDNIQLTDVQAQEITDLLLQYSPEGWLKVYLQFETNDTLTRIKTWAKTEDNPNYGFRLDDADRDELESLLTEAWEECGHLWTNLFFWVSTEGDYEATFA